MEAEEKGRYRLLATRGKAMADTELTQSDPTEIVARLEEASGLLERGLSGRWTALRAIGQEWPAFQAAIDARGLSLGSVALLAVGTALATYLLIVMFRAILHSRKPDTGSWKRGVVILASIALTLLVMAIVTRFAVSDLDLRRVLRTWVFAIAIFYLMRSALLALFPGPTPVSGTIPASAPAEPATPRFRDLLSLAILWAFVGIAISATARIYQAGPGLRDFVGSVIVAAPVTALLAYAYWRHRFVVRRLIATPGSGSRVRQRVAASWPFIAITILILTVVVLQIGLTLGRQLPPLAILLTLVLVLVAPHLDGIVARWSERGTLSPDVSIVALALRRTVRFIIGIGIFCLLIFLWGVPLLTAFGIEARAVARAIVEIGLIALAAAFLWNAVGAFASRVAQSEGVTVSAEEAEAPRTRIGTLLPLITGVVKVSIVAITLLTILVAIGINVWPIIGGLSIFGIAIGFGSQTLVKDVVSGLFFLIDDAFRLGEYIETPGAKGTVEKISVRSVSLRNARGALASVPYGQIGKVINFSRGWVIEKMVFRVAFDTDVDLVRKLFKKIGQEIADDPELKVDLLETFKSQGISAVEDGTLIIRGKFKARAGKQFGIKKAVLTAVQKAFRENDIHAVPRPLGPVPST